MAVIYTYYGTCMTYFYTTEKRYIFRTHKLKDTDLCRNCLSVYSFKRWKIICQWSAATARKTYTNSHNSFCWSLGYNIGNISVLWWILNKFKNKIWCPLLRKFDISVKHVLKLFLTYMYSPNSLHISLTVELLINEK